MTPTTSEPPTEGAYFFDEAAADRVVRFFEKRLRHFEGRFAGQRFVLQPWQRTLVRDVFGWRRRDGTRRYRTVYIEIPRKNGKSAFAAGLALFMLYGDGEPGAQCYSAAATREQANITFNAARKMIAASAELGKRLDVKQYHVAHPASDSIYRALSGEHLGKHGLNAHFVLVDEMHELTSPNAAALFEALVTSMGARTQPLTFIITTAGHGGDDALPRQMHDRAAAAIAGKSEDDSFYGVIYAADPTDDWSDEAIWAKANPSLGETVTLEYLRGESVKAKESPAYLNTFLRLYLNVWTEQATRWLDVDKFGARCGPVDPAAVAKLPCYAGTDLSTSYDFAAVVAIYVEPSGRWIVVPTLYLPEETARRRQREHGTPLLKWIEDGHVVGTAGPTVDYDRIEADVLRLSASGRLRVVGFDPYNATQIMGRLERAGVTTVEVSQTFLGMSAAAKEFERRLANGTVLIADNPALRWMAANVEVDTDRLGNIRPVKPRQKGKYAGTRRYSIDGVVALIVAATRAMLHDPGREANAHARLEIVFA